MGFSSGPYFSDGQYFPISPGYIARRVQPHAHTFTQQLSYILVVRLQLLVSDTDKDLLFELLVLDPASESASICSPNDSPCPGVEYVFTLVTPSDKKCIGV